MCYIFSVLIIFVPKRIPNGASNNAEWFELGTESTNTPQWYQLDEEPKMLDPIHERIAM
jgi:hypothetical protein